MRSGSAILEDVIMGFRSPFTIQTRICFFQPQHPAAGLPAGWGNVDKAFNKVSRGGGGSSSYRELLHQGLFSVADSGTTWMLFVAARPLTPADMERASRPASDATRRETHGSPAQHAIRNPRGW
jgi:hypothetical protein